MKITQPDSRSITIVPDTGIRIFVPYRFFWNGHERPAESIALSAGQGRGTGTARTGAASWDVRAFFLFGEIRDTITEDSAGITLRRTWIVKTTGSLHLSIELEMPAGDVEKWLFPGVHCGEGVPATTISFLGEKTSLPSAASLAGGDRLCHFFSRSAWNEGSLAAIGIGRTEIEGEGSRFRVEVRFPGIEEPRSRTGPRPDHQAAPTEETLESPGSVERSHELSMTCAPAQTMGLRGPGAAVARIAPRSSGSPGPSADVRRLGRDIASSLPGHLLAEAGIAGIREHPGSPWLSSSAGAGYAVALRSLFPSDETLGETALRLADFSLKGQTSSGMFYESFHVGTGQWRGVKGRAGEPVLSLGSSALIAERLLLLSRDLEAAGLPHEKYWLAGLRFVDFFFDGKSKLVMPGSLHAPNERAALEQDPEGLGGLELLFPLAIVLEKTGKDRYRKALEALAKRFSSIAWDPFRPPSSRDGRSPDAAGALLAVRLFLAMRSLGFRPAEPTVSSAAAARASAAASARLFAALLVPWVRIHPADDSAFAGCLVDSFTCQRIIFRCLETALLLLRLRQIAAEADVKALLRDLARLCLRAAGDSSLGASFVQHTRWDVDGKPGEGRGKRGPIDARRIATEVLAGLELAKEFPRV